MRISAGTFVRLAQSSSAAKQRFVLRSLTDGKWPGYRPRDDYWVRVRNSLKRLLRSGDVTRSAVANETPEFPLSRRAEAASLFDAFADGWSSLGASVIEGRRLSAQVGSVAISCAPHLTVAVGRRRLALRFSYWYSALLRRDDKVQIELLRLALGSSGIVPGILNIRNVSIHVPRHDPATLAYIRAEARYLASIWAANGGPPQRPASRAGVRGRSDGIRFPARAVHQRRDSG